MTYLQDLLDRAGFDPGEPTTYYGEELEKTLIGFQENYGLPADGLPNGATWAELLHVSDKKCPDPIGEIDWAAEYPEIFSLASSASVEDYLRDIDLSAAFADDSSEGE